MNFFQRLVLGNDLAENKEQTIENESEERSHFPFLGGGFFSTSNTYQEVLMSELLSIPTARKLVEQISGTMASFDFVIYNNHSTKGNVKQMIIDKIY